MATTSTTYSGNGSTTAFTFTIPYLRTTDVKAKIGGVATTAFSVSGSTVTFDSAPASGTNNVEIYRDTDDTSLASTFASGAAIKASALNDNFKHSLYSIQESNNTVATVVTSDGDTVYTGDVQLGANVGVKFEGTTANAHELRLIAADPGSDVTLTLPAVTGNVVTTGDTGTVTATMLAADSVDSSELVDGSIDTAHIANAQVTTAKLAADAVTNAKIADNAIDSEHYTNGSIDTAHIDDSQITAAKIASNAVTTVKINADAITGAKIADNAIDSEHYTDGSIDTAHIADLNVTTAKIAADAITGAKIADDSVDSEHLVADSIDAEHYAAGSVDTTALGADAVTGAKIADDAIDSEHYTDGSIDTAHIADLQVTTAKIAADAVTGAKIPDNAIDSEHYTDGSIDTAHIADDQITAAKIADDVINSEHIAAGAIDLEHMSSESVDEDNLHISNSGSNGQYLQKQSGNAGGLTWASPGGGTATAITIADESSDTTCFPLFSTAATGDIAPKSDSQLIYNSNTGALGATTFVGNVDAVDGDFDGTLEADAITVDGTALDEYIADTVGGMVTGNTETGITVTYQDADNTLDFALAADSVSGSNIADDAIGSEHIADDAVGMAAIANEAVNEARMLISNAGSNGQYLQKQSGNSGGLTWASVDLSPYMPLTGGTITGAVTLDNGTNAGKDITWDEANDRVVFEDSVELRFGASSDLRIYHNGSNSYILHNGTGNLHVKTNASGEDLYLKGFDDVRIQVEDGEDGIKVIGGGACEIYHANTKTFETLSTGVRVQGGLCFGSDTAETNHLDDYEEGTWAVQLTGATSGTATGGSTGTGFDTEDGVYTKIGNLVMWSMHLEDVHDSGCSGDLRFSLPFTAGNGEGSVAAHRVYGNAAGAGVNTETATSKNAHLESEVRGGDAFCTIAEVLDNAAIDYINTVNVDNDANDIFLSGHFYTT